MPFQYSTQLIRTYTTLMLTLVDSVYILTCSSRRPAIIILEETRSGSSQRRTACQGTQGQTIPTLAVGLTIILYQQLYFVEVKTDALERLCGHDKGSKARCCYFLFFSNHQSTTGSQFKEQLILATITQPPQPSSAIPSKRSQPKELPR